MTLSFRVVASFPAVPPTWETLASSSLLSTVLSCSASLSTSHFGASNASPSSQHFLNQPDPEHASILPGHFNSLLLPWHVRNAQRSNLQQSSFSSMLRSQRSGFPRVSATAVPGPAFGATAIAAFGATAGSSRGMATSVVPFPLAQTGEGISECELIQWFVKVTW